MEKKGYLLLANGKLFEGVLRGAQKSATAELVFTTAMSGYMDVLTDPSYEGQIVIQTFPTIGNPGVIAPECSGSHLSGYVVRELCDTPSNFRCEGKLEDFLAEQGIPCLTGVDTRALTRCIRNNGVMNAAILTEKPADVAAAAAELAAAKITVSLPQEDVSTITTAAGEGKHHVVLWNFGAKGAIQRELEERGCTVTVVPANACAEDILRLAPDGVVLGSGAGDPAEQTAIIEQIGNVCKQRLPMLGIGLGHQLLALSQGAATSKMKYGHRGGNQPAKDVKTGQVYMTAQAHGYVVEGNTLPENIAVRYVNINDGTCEGVDYIGMPAFSVQFHPESDGGPLDTRFLFDRFVAMMEGRK